MPLKHFDSEEVKKKATTKAELYIHLSNALSSQLDQHFNCPLEISNFSFSTLPRILPQGV